MRRGLVPAQLTHRLTAAVREEGLLPALPRGAWVARLRARLAGRRARPVGRQPDGALDYDEILARTRPTRNGEAPRANVR